MAMVSDTAARELSSLAFSAFSRNSCASSAILSNPDAENDEAKSGAEQAGYYAILQLSPRARVYFYGMQLSIRPAKTSQRSGGEMHPSLASAFSTRNEE